MDRRTIKAISLSSVRPGLQSISKWKATGCIEVGGLTAKVTVDAFGSDHAYSGAVSAIRQARLLNVINRHWAIDGEATKPGCYKLVGDQAELYVYVDL